MTLLIVVFIYSITIIIVVFIVAFTILSHSRFRLMTGCQIIPTQNTQYSQKIIISSRQTLQLTGLSSLKSQASLVYGSVTATL